MFLNFSRSFWQFVYDRWRIDLQNYIKTILSLLILRIAALWSVENSDMIFDILSKESSKIINTCTIGLPYIKDDNRSMKEDNRSIKDHNRSIKDHNRSIKDHNRSRNDDNRELY